MVERRINGMLTSTKAFKDIYPFKSSFTNVNGHIMHYIDKGNGKPVLMLHGNPTWSFYFRRLISTLSKDFRAIAPDHIGCGFSDKPDEKNYDYTLQSRINDLDTFISQLNIKEKINLILHDWGGIIGLAWALEHPEKTDKIIITNTAGFLLPKNKRFPFILGIIKYCKLFAVPAVLGANAFALGALVLACKTKLSLDVRQGFIEPYNCRKNRISNLKFVQDIPINRKDKSYAIVKHVDKHLEILNENKLMFIWGSKDFVFDLKFFYEFKKRFPTAVSHIFHDAGHYLFEDKPEESIKIIGNFLSQYTS
jgi:cis-3-alkyl-4-acyloxetan-2-one decarboxylase